MGPPRRVSSNSNPRTSHTSSNDSSEPSQSPVAQRLHSQPSAPPQPQQPKLGMSPASRYNHNLKVLRRRDPSIMSIFDQFSHVCLYHHNGEKWEKQGFEGSMFLYERESYPPYGFYILNRMGMDDHIQRLYPEDIISAHGSYLIIRSYPEYTRRRLTIARSSSHEIPHKFSDVYAIPEIPVQEKGEATTIGLWMFATDAREPMIDVLKRLHSYIKKNVPYPDEYRYGPNKPPPPNPHLRTTTTSVPLQLKNGESQSIQRPSSTMSSHSHIETSRGSFIDHNPSQAYTNGNTSELDKLFAKIEPTPVPSAAVASSSIPTLNSTSNMTVESLFAALSGGDMVQPKQDTLTSSTSTGLSLLDTIFASASNVPNPGVSSATTHHPSTPQSKSQPELITIYSPTPSTNTLPQILNQDVISTLLGLPPTRATSAASTAYSSGARSHPSSREGDNEDESDAPRGRGSDGYSESSTVLDPEVEFDNEFRAVGANAGRPLLGRGHQAPGDTGLLGASNQGRIHGDVTPRAPLNGFITPPLARSNGSRYSDTHTTSTTYPVTEILSSSSPALHSRRPSSRPYSRTGNSEPQHHMNGTLNTRRLVPFDTESELWPYPRAPMDERSTDTDGEDIIELDFEDTSALSDPSAFNRALQNGRKHARGNNPGGAASDNAGSRENTRSKKGKRDRAAEQLRQREEIENSWDVPAPSRLSGDVLMMSGPASPSPCPSPEPFSASTSILRTPIPPKLPEKTNGFTPKTETKGEGSLINMNIVRESLAASISTQASVPKNIERNEFVREVLTLIHTNKNFVDVLWQDYTNRLA